MTQRTNAHRTEIRVHLESPRRFVPGRDVRRRGLFENREAVFLFRCRYCERNGRVRGRRETEGRRSALDDRDHGPCGERCPSETERREKGSRSFPKNARFHERFRFLLSFGGRIRIERDLVRPLRAIENRQPRSGEARTPEPFRPLFQRTPAGFRQKLRQYRTPQPQSFRSCPGA